MELEVISQDKEFIGKHPVQSELYVALQSRIIKKMQTEQHNKKIYEMYVRISSPMNKKGVIRLACAHPAHGLDSTHIMLGERTRKELAVKEYDKVTLENVSKWRFLYEHPETSIRVAFIVSMLSIVLGVTAIILTIIYN